jgi:predicted DNA binding CopG/RHH family protein
MNSKRKAIPQFSSEDEEREFWATHDSVEYIDWSKAEKNPTFPRLKPSTRTVSIRLPESLLAALKTLANKRDVPYQSLVKMFLAEKVKEETATYIHSDADEHPEVC